MFSIRKNTNLLNLVREKRVAIVGPAPYLIDSRNGRSIEDYDFVCRVNDLLPPKNIREDYGFRTDIYFSNFATPHLQAIEKKIQNNSDTFENLEMIVCPTIKAKHADTNFLSWENDYVSDVFHNMQKLNYKNIPSYWVGVEDYKKMYSAIGAEPNAGVLAIMILLSHEIKELYVTGFSFNMGGNSYDDVYYRGHLDESYIVPDRIFGPYGGHGISANLKQVDFFKSLCEREDLEPLIRIDSYLKNLLSINIGPRVVTNDNI